MTRVDSMQGTIGVLLKVSPYDGSKSSVNEATIRQSQKNDIGATATARRRFICHQI